MSRVYPSVNLSSSINTVRIANPGVSIISTELFDAPFNLAKENSQNFTTLQDTIGGSTILDLNYTSNKLFYFPSVNVEQLSAISVDSNSKGLIVFLNAPGDPYGDKGLYIYSGTAWQRMETTIPLWNSIINIG